MKFNFRSRNVQNEFSINRLVNIYTRIFYDDLKKTPEVLTKINLENKFPLEFDGTNDAGKKSKAKYINAAKIKQKLKQLGF
jgi:hypothetical protein